LADRKSVFSDLSDEDEDDGVKINNHYHQQHDIFPNVIIKNQYEQAQHEASSSPSLRQYGRQRSVFQTPGKDILTSLVSRDDLAVIGQESVDAGGPKDRRRRPPSPPSPHKGARPAVYDETYRRSMTAGRRHPEEVVPSRHSAKKNEEKPEKNGCFYVMTALDFCWCL